MKGMGAPAPKRPNYKHLDNVDMASTILTSAWSKNMTPEAAVKIHEWDKIMTRKVYRIELKIDFDDDSRHEHMVNVMTQYARDTLASAMLLADNRKPMVALISDDSFVGTEEIELLSAGDEIHTPDTL
jgi:hypothetical protein